MRSTCDWRLWLLGVLLAGCAWSAPPAPRVAPAALVKGVFESREQALENLLGQLMLRRPELAGDRSAALELQIDLRILERWMLTHAAAAPAMSDLQVGWRLRSAILKDAIAAIDQILESRGWKLDPAQAQAATRVHELTFSLPEVKSLKELDAVAQRLGAELAVLLGAAGKLPVMRPQPLDQPMPNKRSDHDQSQAVSPGEQVLRLTISVPLRQQLLALVKAAAPSPGGEKDAAISAMLDTCVDLARGLQYNTAVSPEARLGMESQLAEGIALYLDPRTRDLGKSRIAAMGQYRQLLLRVGKLNLTPAQVAQFAPVLNYARDNPQTAPKILSAMEEYTSTRARFDARAKTPGPIPAVARAQSDLERQFSVAFAAFASAALDLPKGLGTSVADLENRAQDLDRIVSTLEQLDRMAADITLLNAFKPRPGGGLEKRVALAAIAAANPAASVPRSEATHYLGDVDRLARNVGELEKLNTADIPAYLEKRWTGGKLEALEAHWKAVVTEQASLLATGTPTDDPKVDRLLVAVSLVDALRSATTMDANLAQAQPLERWVDWRMTIDDLKPFLRPYPDAMASAFSAYLSDNAAGLDLWIRMEARYHGVVALINRDAAYRQPCEALPTGPAALAAQMLTPLDAQPFAIERYTAWCVWLYSSRSEMADEIFALLNRRLGE